MSLRALAPVAAVVVATFALVTRRRRCRAGFGRGFGGPGPAGDREQRTPLVPAASGAAALPLPE